MVEKYKKSNSKNKKENQKIRKEKDFRFLTFTFNFSFLSFNLLPIILLIIFLIPGIVGLLHSGFPITDDGNWMIIRFSAFYDALRHGQFPVRFLPRLNHEYGYPVADFLYPLFMYIGFPLHLLKVNYVNTIKIILGGSFILSGIFCYLWFRKMFDSITSFVGALVYGLFPYHLYDIYQRGSVGEVLALCIVPFIFWQIASRGKKSFAPTALGIALLILSHNTLALLSLPIIIIYMLLKGLMFRKVLIVVLTALGISAFFWIPALYDKQFTVFDKIQVSNFSQYFVTTNNIGLIGLFSVAVLLISFSFVFKKNKKLELFFLLVTYIAIIFTSPLFTVLWKILPLPQLVQFPFRFLSIVMLGVAFLTTAIITEMKRSLKVGIAGLCIVLLYVSAWKYMFPSSYQMYPDGYYATNEDTTTVQNEYMPTWVKQIPLSSPKSSVEVIKGNGSVTDIITSNPNKIQFLATIDELSLIRINTVYFPGWTVFVNNKQHDILYNNTYGVMDVHVQPGNYQIVAKFGETGVRMISDIVSLLSFIILCGYMLCRNKLLDCYIAKLLNKKITI